MLTFNQNTAPPGTGTSETGKLGYLDLTDGGHLDLTDGGYLELTDGGYLELTKDGYLELTNGGYLELTNFRLQGKFARCSMQHAACTTVQQ